MLFRFHFSRIWDREQLLDRRAKELERFQHTHQGESIVDSWKEDTIAELKPDKYGWDEEGVGTVGGDVCFVMNSWQYCVMLAFE